MALVGDELNIEGADRLWSCSEFDLAVISDLTSGVGELVHYLQSRLTIAEGEIDTADELDWFGSYLENGLNVPAGRAYMLSQTTKFDDYYMPLVAGRPPGPKPSIRIADHARRQIESLENAGASGFVREVTRILNKQGGPVQT